MAGLGIGVAIFVAILLPIVAAGFGFVYGLVIAAVWNFILARVDGFDVLVEIPKQDAFKPRK